MWGDLRRWMGALPYSDALERRQASLLQGLEIGLLLVVLICLPFPFLSAMQPAGRLIIAGLLGAVALSCLGALALLRRGRSEPSALLLAGALAALLCVMLYGNTLEDGAVTMFSLALPITLGGLLAGRRGLLLILGLSVAGVAAALLLAQAGAPGAGFAESRGDTSLSAAVSFAIVAGLLGLFIDSLRSLISDSLMARRARERELEALSRRLEAAVKERTADLEMALSGLEQRAAEQQRLLAENERQQALIRELSVPVLPISASTVVMPLVGALDGERLQIVQSQALSAIERLAARRLLLDITGVPLIDTHVAQGLIQTLEAARLLGAEVVLVGVRPEVAQSVVGLGVELHAMRSYADLQTALGAVGLAANGRRGRPNDPLA